MTYDRFHTTRPLNDPYANPYRVTDPDREVGSADALLLGALLLFAIGGFIYFSYSGTNDRETVLSHDMRPQIGQQPKAAARLTSPDTMGAGGAEQPAGPQ